MWEPGLPAMAVALSTRLSNHYSDRNYPPLRLIDAPLQRS